MRWLGVALALGACDHSAPAPAACDALRASYDAARSSAPCTTDAECVDAPNVAHPHTEDENGMRNWETNPFPCAQVTHRDALARVDAAAHAFETAGCGALVPARTHCESGPSGHGYHPICAATHHCEPGY